MVFENCSTLNHSDAGDVAFPRAAAKQIKAQKRSHHLNQDQSIRHREEPESAEREAARRMLTER